MNEQDGKRKKMVGSPILAPKGNVKGIGKLGQYTGGLQPLVTKPQPGLPDRRIAPTIFRGYGTDQVVNRRNASGNKGSGGRRGK